MQGVLKGGGCKVVSFGLRRANATKNRYGGACAAYIMLLYPENSVDTMQRVRFRRLLAQ